MESNPLLKLSSLALAPNIKTILSLMVFQAMVIISLNTLKETKLPHQLRCPRATGVSYGFYWEDSTAYCTWKTKELIGATEKINLEFSKENCLHPKFASQKYIDFNQKTKTL